MHEVFCGSQNFFFPEVFLDSFHKPPPGLTGQPICGLQTGKKWGNWFSDRADNLWPLRQGDIPLHASRSRQWWGQGASANQQPLKGISWLVSCHTNQLCSLPWTFHHLPANLCLLNLMLWENQWNRGRGYSSSHTELWFVSPVQSAHEDYRSG